MNLHEIFQKWLNRMRGVQTKTMHYTAVVLSYFDRLRLISRFRSQLPKGWKIVAHHMTINVGQVDEGPVDPSRIGEKVALRVVSFAQNDRVAAVGVEAPIDSDNAQKHVTLAVAPGATPKESNDLENWEPVEPMTVRGVVKEVPSEIPFTPSEKVSRDPSLPASDDPVEFIRKDMAGKPDMVIRRAMKGKFPKLSDEEIDVYIAQAEAP